MGLELVWAAHRCDAVRGTRKMILNDLALIADDDTGLVRIPVAEIAKVGGWSQRTVKRALKDLLAKGLVVIEPGLDRVRCYRLCIDREA